MTTVGVQYNSSWRSDAKDWRVNPQVKRIASWCFLVCGFILSKTRWQISSNSICFACKAASSSVSRRLRCACILAWPFLLCSLSLTAWGMSGAVGAEVSAGTWADGPGMLSCLIHAHFLAELLWATLMSTLLLYARISSFSMIFNIHATFGNIIRLGHCCRMCFEPLAIYAMSSWPFPTIFNDFRCFYGISDVCSLIYDLSLHWWTIYAFPIL